MIITLKPKATYSQATVKHNAVLPEPVSNCNKQFPFNSGDVQKLYAIICIGSGLEIPIPIKNFESSSESSFSR